MMLLMWRFRQVKEEKCATDFAILNSSVPGCIFFKEGWSFTQGNGLSTDVANTPISRFVFSKSCRSASEYSSRELLQEVSKGRNGAVQEPFVVAVAWNQRRHLRNCMQSVAEQFDSRTRVSCVFPKRTQKLMNSEATCFFIRVRWRQQWRFDVMKLQLLRSCEIQPRFNVRKFLRGYRQTARLHVRYEYIKCV